MTGSNGRRNGAQRLVLVDRPYLSWQLRDVIDRLGAPVVLTSAARALGVDAKTNALSEVEAVVAARAAERTLVYTSSENALPWVARNLDFTHLPELVALFKDKARFRTLLRERHPDFFFREVAAADLPGLPADGLPFPVVVKPTKGFFSLGVVSVSDAAEWPRARRAIAERIEAARDLYPDEVLDPTSFVIEERIEGEEFAIDAYFDAAGEPVVEGIWAHAFASDADTGDRVYTTSTAVVGDNLDEFTRFLTELGRLTNARDIPVHVELRRTPDRRLVPIEVNPLRFGGWCSTADATWHAWGFSPYVHFLEQQRPDWATLLARATKSRFSIVVLDNSTGIDGRDIRSFDYHALLARFHHPLEIRRVDHTRHPLFGFLFLRTDPGHEDELDWILRSDLREFVAERQES